MFTRGPGHHPFGEAHGCSPVSLPTPYLDIHFPTIHTLKSKRKRCTKDSIRYLSKEFTYMRHYMRLISSTYVEKHRPLQT